MLVTDDEEIFKKCWAYKDHGKSYDAVYHREHAPGFRWLHESFGTNWRMTEIQAAIGWRELGETSLMLLVHPTLTEENISDTIRVVKDVVTRATR